MNEESHVRYDANGRRRNGTKAGRGTVTGATPDEKLTEKELLLRAKRRKEEYLAMAAKLRVQAERRRLIPKQEAERNLAGLAERVRFVIEPIPERQYKFFASVTDPAEMKRHLEELCEYIIAKIGDDQFERRPIPVDQVLPPEAEGSPE